MIHVCFSLYDKTGRYSKFTGTAILSLFENTNSAVTVHILHDNTLTFDSREKFSYVAGQHNQRVKFYNVEELCADRIAEIQNIMSEQFRNIYSIAAMYRFMIPYLLPPDIYKIIYMDSDIVVNLDIAELWRVELNEKPIGVIPTLSQNARRDWMNSNFKTCRDGLIKVEDYFNSGVLLINLKVFREEEEEILNGIKFIASHPEYIFFDQDVLNYCFSTRALKLPTKFNRYVRYARNDKEPLDRKIYHYVGQNLIWSFGADTSDPFNHLWLDYFIRTPWFDAETIGRLYKIFERNYNNVINMIKNSVVNVSAIMSGKTREFFTTPENIQAIKNLFSVHDDEKIISTDDPDALERLIADMNTSRGKKVFFIMVPNFPFKILIESGFETGKDFVNGMDFLSEAHGFPLNSYALIKSM